MGSLSPWLDLAKKYLGQHEIAGKKDNQFILDCFKHTSYQAAHDEVPWCAAFVCRVLEESGYKSTNNAAAMSYAKYGSPAAHLEPGCILVFEWAPGEHHVTICDEVIGNDYVKCLGGNQSDMVKDSVFPRNKIIATRWPVK